MPLISKLSSNEADILLWQLEESSDELLGMMTLSDPETDFLKKLHGEKRRAEWLCWHLMVRNYFGCEQIEISYDSSGRPIVDRKLNREISVSHGGNIVAVIISKSFCGIDIESLNRNFSRVQNRFMTASECNILTPLSDIADVAAIGWCAKECAYKISRCDGIDFIRDLTIISASRENRTLTIKFSHGSTFSINVEIIDNHIICHSIK